jgi:DNA-damage-inducible protein D
MGKTEMAAHLFRITQTDEKIKNENIRGQEQLEDAAKSVGKTVRRTMLELNNIAPENLPVTAHIKDVKKNLKNTSKKMKEIDSSKSKNLPE